MLVLVTRPGIQPCPLFISFYRAALLILMPSLISVTTDQSRARCQCFLFYCYIRRARIISPSLVRRVRVRECCSNSRPGFDHTAPVSAPSVQMISHVLAWLSPFCLPFVLLLLAAFLQSRELYGNLRPLLACFPVIFTIKCPHCGRPLARTRRTISSEIRS